MNLDMPRSVVDMGVTGFSPPKHDGLEVEWPPPGVRHGHVYYPLKLVSLGLVAVGAEDFHHHVQGPGPGQCHVLQ